MNPYSGYGEGFLAYDDQDDLEYLEELSAKMEEKSHPVERKMSPEDYERMLLGYDAKSKVQSLSLTQYDMMLIGLLR